MPALWKTDKAEPTHVDCIAMTWVDRAFGKEKWKWCSPGPATGPSTSYVWRRIPGGPRMQALDFPNWPWIPIWEQTIDHGRSRKMAKSTALSQKANSCSRLKFPKPFRIHPIPEPNFALFPQRNRRSHSQTWHFYFIWIFVGLTKDSEACQQTKMRLEAGFPCHRQTASYLMLFLEKIQSTRKRVRKWCELCTDFPELIYWSFWFFLNKMLIKF